MLKTESGHMSIIPPFDIKSIVSISDFRGNWCTRGCVVISQDEVGGWRWSLELSARETRVAARLGIGITRSSIFMTLSSP